MAGLLLWGAWMSLRCTAAWPSVSALWSHSLHVRRCAPRPTPYGPRLSITLSPSSLPGRRPALPTERQAGQQYGKALQRAGCVDEADVWLRAPLGANPWADPPHTQATTVAGTAARTHLYYSPPPPDMAMSTKRLRRTHGGHHMV